MKTELHHMLVPTVQVSSNKQFFELLKPLKNIKRHSLP